MSAREGPGRAPRSPRLPLVLSSTALVVAFFGSTPAGTAALETLQQARNSAGPQQGAVRGTTTGSGSLPRQPLIFTAEVNVARPGQPFVFGRASGFVRCGASGACARAGVRGRLRDGAEPVRPGPPSGGRGGRNPRVSTAVRAAVARRAGEPSAAGLCVSAR